jgi:transposase, IS5 family
MTQNPCREPFASMYRKAELAPSPPSDFELPFEGRLSADNRWVKMAELIPWSEFEEAYAENFPNYMGAPAKSFRMALGALIIKEKLGISDRETVEPIRENPYLQYFIGQSTYTNEAPFDPSLLVHFRQRISANLINKVKERMVLKIWETTPNSPEKKKDSPAQNESPNQGKLIIDATCAPGDISYPTDLGLLNKSRVHTEKIIDILYKSLKGKINKKPRTNPKNSQKRLLSSSETKTTVPQQKKTSN